LISLTNRVEIVTPMSQPSFFWWHKPHLRFLCEKNQAEPAYLETYSANTQQWVKASMKTASVTPPDCKLGKT
jgi:hypothetical protein